MFKRGVAALLWFGAAWFGYEIVWSLTGIVRLGGPVIASAIAAVVVVDPMGWFWPRSARPNVDAALDRARLPA
jgi:hypothetical protein